MSLIRTTVRSGRYEECSRENNSKANDLPPSRSKLSEQLQIVLEEKLWNIFQPDFSNHL